jgi:hypothetical protein
LSEIEITAALGDFYFHDRRVVLIPIEALTPAGVDPTFSAMLRRCAGWEDARVELFNAAFSRYWQRTAALARRTRTWMPPRLRHVALVRDPWSVRPYIQVLNISSWMLYEQDFDPATSSAELAAYLLVHGDRMALTGEVTRAAIHDAAYWFDRNEGECESFSEGAARSQRPDADAIRALAAALPWLRQLSHETLRPPTLISAYRAIPGTGLLVRKDLEEKAPALVNRWREVADDALKRFRSRLPRADAKAVARITDRLVAERPQLLISAQRERILWDPKAAERIGSLRSELKAATAAALEDIGRDLDVVHAKTVAFHAALRDPAALPRPAAAMEQRGYVFLHGERGLIAYNLHEPGLERLQGPAIPYARAMLGARTVHEWAHLAVDAGWVPSQVTPEAFARRAAAAAALLDEIVAAAPAVIRQRTAADVRALLAPPRRSVGQALVDIILARASDYQANLLAQRFLTQTERETYVRQNVRELRSQTPPERLWRMLARYLYEYQYLNFSVVDDPEEYFLRSTWFDADFIDSGIMDRPRFRSLAASVADICGAFAVDEGKFTPWR